MNEDGIVQSVSDSVKDVFGWTPEELLGRNVNVLIPEPRRSALDRYLDRYRHPARRTALRRTRRFDAVHKDGRPIEIELSVSRAELPANSSPFFVGIIRDVTGHIDVGAEVAAERVRLQHLVTEQTRALASANLRLQLSDRLASLGTLAAGLGHDMNNVLLPIRARLNALEHAGLPRGAASHLAAVRRSLAYLQHLSDGLHVLAADPNSVAPDGRGTTKLAEWWSEVGSLLRKSVPSFVDLRVSLPPALPAVAIAPDWLTQAILNLLVNAGEAFPPKARSARVIVSARMAPDGRAVRLAVRDNGRGMTAVILRRAFDLFFTTKSRTMGTGFGLPLVRKVAERAGGTIELVSAPGRGTTATLVLPIAPDGERPRRARAVATVHVRNPASRALIARALLGCGATITSPGVPLDAASMLFVADPTSRNLAAARRWRKAREHAPLFLIGAPSRSTVAPWKALGAVTIDPYGDIDLIRHALGDDARTPVPTAAPKRKAKKP